MSSQISRISQDSDAPDASGWSASLYNKTASFVYSAGFVAPVLNLLAAQPGERILDVGCGSGEVTFVIDKVVRRQKGGLVVGVDYSESMIEKAKANGIEHAFIGDAQALQIPEEFQEHVGKFDAVFSNATLHWCKQNPAGVLEGVKKVLKPGGRFVAEMGGFLNCIGLRMALSEAVRSRGRDPKVYDPWYFPSVEDYTKLLVAANFEPIHISLNPRFTEIPSGLYDWMKLFARNSFLIDFNDEEADEIMKEVEEKCRVDCQDESGRWALMYARLRFSAVLK